LSNVAQLRTVAPDGTSNQVFASFSDDTIEAIRNPNTAEWIYAAAPAALLGRYQLFRGTSFNVSSSSNTLVTSTDFESLQDIAISPNNATIFFVGATSIDDSLKVYSVPRTGGTPSVLDFGRELAVSPVGNKIAYVKDNSGGSAADIYVRDLTAGTVVKITSTSGEYAYPSFNRAGDRIVYALDDGTSWDLYSIPAAGGSPTRLTDTDLLDEYGAYYNGDGSKLAFARIGVSTGETGVFVANANGSAITQIVDDETTGPRVYWTTPTGRTIGGAPIRFERPGREKRRK
jgi:Tol biopolymer transport system component